MLRYTRITIALRSGCRPAVFFGLSQRVIRMLINRRVVGAFAGLVWAVVIASGTIGVGFNGLAQEVGALRSLDSHFPFVVPRSVDTWSTRAEALRFHLLVSLGLWPLPDKTPLQAVEHGEIDLGDYRVSRVYFESFPGFFVTGNLYRPTRLAAPGPGVLAPYGHFRNGRFTDNPPQEVARMIAAGEESHEPNARSPLQAHCAHLARLGCTVFHYDMIGYADSQQIPFEVAHGFAKQREGQNAPSAYAFFSPRAELHLQSIMGLQTWNSIRALDFLSSLPEVDPTRIGVTGCSGGGTQTFILTAIDPRVTAAFPAAMVSTGMQGGCVCENCCHLRTVTGNVEITGLAAPRPVALSAANDWTKTMPVDGMPELQALYRLVDAADHTFLSPSLTFPHGYNQVARRVMYAWFDRHLRLQADRHGLSLDQVHRGEIPDDSPLQERPIRFLEPNELSVWNDQHRRPPAGIEIEHQVTAHWRKDQAAKVQALIDQQPQEVKRAVRSLLSDLPHGVADDALRIVIDEPVSSPVLDDPNFAARRQVIGNRTDTPGIEIVRITSKDSEQSRRFTCVITDDPLEWLADPSVSPIVRASRTTVVINGKGWRVANQLVDNGREAAGYTFGYNRPQVARGARAVAWLLDQEELPADVRVQLVVWDGSPAAAIVAAAAAERKVDQLLIEREYRFEGIESFRDADFLPGALTLGDSPGFLRIAGIAAPVYLGSRTEEKIDAALKALASEIP